MKVFAVKVVEVELAEKSEKIHVIINELSVLKCTTHPNLVRLFDAYMRTSKLYVRSIPRHHQSLIHSF